MSPSATPVDPDATPVDPDATPAQALAEFEAQDASGVGQPLYRGGALSVQSLAATMRTLLDRAMATERRALAAHHRAIELGDPAMVDRSRRIWLAAEQNLDECADMAWRAGVRP
jgi:hypothetical protein